MRFAPLFFCFAASIVGGTPRPASAADERYVGKMGVLVHPRNAEELDEVLAVSDRVLDDRLRIGPLHVVVGNDGLAALRVAGIDSEVLVDDLEEGFRRERERIRERQSWEGTVAGGKDRAGQRADEAVEIEAWYGDFRTLDEINQRINELVSAYSDRFSIRTIGYSLEGRAIRALRIAGGTAADRPGVVYIGAQHAREWLSPMTVMYIAEQLVRGYERDPEITRVLKGTEFWVIPVMNPDGYAYSWDPDGDRMWRKNRRDGIGVDLNRNWSFKWGEREEDYANSSDPDENTYRGTAPFSEPESKAVSDFIVGERNLRAMVDVHSYAQYIVDNPGCEHEEIPQAYAQETMSSALASRISAVHEVEYERIRGIDWYPVCGDSLEWGTYVAGCSPSRSKCDPNTEAEARRSPPIQTKFCRPPKKTLWGPWTWRDG